MKVQINIRSPKNLRGNVNTQFLTHKKKRRNFKIYGATEVDKSASESDETGLVALNIKLHGGNPQKRVARMVYIKKNYDYLKIMMSSVYKRVEKEKKRRISRKRTMAPSDKESRDVIIEGTEKLSRFK